MISEILSVRIKPGTHIDFEAAMAAALPLFQRSRGCRSMRLERSIEDPDSYRLVIGWERLEDHTVHFAASEELQEFRRLAAGYVLPGGKVEHLQVVLAGF